MNNITTSATTTWLQSPIDDAIAGLMTGFNISRQEAGLLYANVAQLEAAEREHRPRNRQDMLALATLLPYAVQAMDAR